CEVLPVDDCGRLDLAACVRALEQGAGPALLCVQLANNETGTLQDLSAIIDLLRAADGDHCLLLDACQGAGKLAIDLAAWGVDLCVCSGHKFGAPKGCGVLAVRGVPIEPLIRGGRQQQDRRSGTEDPAAVAAMAAALEATRSAWRASGAAIAAATEVAWRRIVDSLPAAQWNARAADRLSGVLNIAHPGIDAAALVTRLDLAGFAVSRGAACMAAGNRPSHVLTAIGLDQELARGAIRISAGPLTSAEDLLACADAYVREVRAMLVAGG
ncbi:MAG: cysteine desulfurase family protein, partial [Planctomycetota bacterium]